ncbi:proline iminopeptidase [Legionella birminghamensis]|uniref:Proline iminopeptidase n=1 Tax=Legionella birminghamensis TaxID=28083 RepID=A0A378IFN1_9GAMM|nr:prolyl aminopeptidase [Legionella birminghamensis]KTC68255.1 proline iminopeptidase [Legionella birminghamensis]STX31034.1 proline iminopeptidase [Legionella birminghamensis]
MSKMFTLILAAILLTGYQLAFSMSKIQSQETYLFPAIKPYKEDYLSVSSLHKLWYAEYGNPKGRPVVVLHGGPGAGCGDNDMRFFDPAYWRIILLDQRGAKRSQPFGEMRENTTQDLIADLERLREHLQIKQWLVFGGSWGSALALAYGEAHPDKVTGFILRGIFLGRQRESNQLLYGMRDTFPDAWQEFSDFIPAEKRDDLGDAYYQLVMNTDPGIALPAAKALMKYDLTCSFIKLGQTQLNALLSDDKLVLGIAKAFIYYNKNHFFLKENQLLDNIGKINHLPLIIVHGRYDTVTRASTAFELHQAWPNSRLVFADASGHSAMEINVTKELVKATEAMKKL